VAGFGNAATATISVAGSTVVALHLALTAFNQWVVYDQFRVRTPEGLRAGLAAVFLTNGVRLMSAEVMALAAAGLIAVGLARHWQSNRDNRRMLGVLLLSYLPIALHSLGVATAFLSGWQLDVWIASNAAASPEEIAATLREAIPVVLEPLAAGRALAIVASAIVFAILQRRVCGLAPRTALGTAAMFAGILTLARVAA